MAKVTLVLEDSGEEGLKMNLHSDPDFPSHLDPNPEFTAAQFLGMQAHQYLEEVLDKMQAKHSCSVEEENCGDCCCVDGTNKENS